MSDILMKGTEPIGQVADLTADNVEYSSGVNVKQAIDSKVSKTGDTMTDKLTINRTNTGTSSISSVLELGNNIPDGTTGTSRGVINLYGTGSNMAQIIAGTITDRREILLPDKTGTLALTSDLTPETLFSNHYISTADTWDKVENIPDINNYEYLGFSFGRADNTPDQSAIRTIIPVSTFKQSSTSNPIVIVEDYLTISDTKSVMVCYRSDTSIRRFRGSSVFQYNRLSMFGIGKK